MIDSNKKQKTFNPPRVTTVDQPPVKIRQDEPVMPFTSSTSPILENAEPSILNPQASASQTQTKTSFAPPSLKGSFSKKSKVLATVLFMILILASVPVGVYLVQQRQEIRKEAQTPPGACNDGWDECNQEQCGNEGRSVTENIACRGDMTIITLSEPASSCFYDGEQGYHRFSVNLSKTERLYKPDSGRDALVTIRAVVDRCTCNEGCGTYLEGHEAEKWCVCVSCERHEQELIMPRGAKGQTVTFTQDVPLVGGDCGSAQVDVWFHPEKIEGSEFDVNTCKRAFAATIWLSGKDPSECEDTPDYQLACNLVQPYDQAWNQIDPNTLSVGETIRFAVKGTTDEPGGITQARFRFNQEPWQVTTNQHENGFYLDYQIPNEGTFSVDAMVYNPALGWK